MTAASIPFSPALANDRYKYKYLIAIRHAAECRASVAAGDERRRHDQNTL